MHHFCFVSDQVVPNYLPALEKELRATKVTLAVTKEMKAQARRLREALQKRQIVTEELPLGDDASDFAKLEAILTEWLVAHAEADIVLNATGGTKPMVITAQKLFGEMEKPIFYVDINTDNVWWLEPEKKWCVRCHLDRPVDLDTYLQLYGYKIIQKSTAPMDPNWMKMAEDFASNVREWEHSITVLNALAANAKETLEFRLDDMTSPVIGILDKLKQHGLVKEMGLRTGRWKFTSEEARAFANGGWLEQYLYENLKQVYPNGGMVDLNAKIQRENGAKNELDVLAIVKGNLYVFECKTGNFTRKDSASDAIHKLNSLSKSFGLRATGIVVSYCSLNDSDTQRAKDDGLKFIDSKDLRPERLQSRLRAILK